MNTKKIVVGSLAGGLAYFLLGWVVYGILMKDYCATNLNQTGMRKEEEMILWAIGVSNIAFAMLLALIFSWSNTSSILNATKMAAIIGLLVSISIDLSFYAMTTLYQSRSIIIVDVIVNTILTAIVGAIVYWTMCLGKKEA